jgi:C-terminal processing protease CtpA/Prc
MRAAGLGLLGWCLWSATGAGVVGADETGTVVPAIDPSFGPFFAGRPSGTILQRRVHVTGDAMRLALRRPSLEQAAVLAGGGLLLRLDRFERDAAYELRAALRPGAASVVLDLRHNEGGLLRRMLAVAGIFTGPVAGALRLVRQDEVTELAIPAPRDAPWRGPLTVLVSGVTISSGEVLAALLRRHAGARVLGERTFGKDYAMRVEPIDSEWQALVPDARLEVAGEVLAGGLRPDGPIPDELAARLPTH